MKKKKYTVESLRKSGFRVRVYHCRQKDADEISCRGGYTAVAVTPPNGTQFSTCNGFAHCSKKDNYNKRLGVTIALGRAMKMYDKCGQNVVPPKYIDYESAEATLPTWMKEMINETT